jgi:protein subunit release factor B
VLLRQAVIVAVPDLTVAAAAELLVNGEKEAATNTCTKPIRQQKRRHGFFRSTRMPALACLGKVGIFTHTLKRNSSNSPGDGGSHINR